MGVRSHFGKLGDCSRKRNRTSTRGKQGFRVPGKQNQTAGDFGISRHESKWLFLAIFALAQSRDRGGVGGIAGEVVSAQPFDGDDSASSQQLGGSPDAG
jgi:hypothetical protein